MKTVKNWFQNIKSFNPVWIFISSLLVFVAITCVHSSLSTNFVLNNIVFDTTNPWRRLEFDKLGLDVTLYPNNSEVDFLQSLSIMNLTSAYYTRGIEKLILWTDERDIGFQGTGVDQRIGEAKWDGSSFTWYWDDMGLTVPESGLRIFVSVETERNMADNRTVQFSIPELLDNNENGKFDIGDKGAFFYSGDNGPIGLEISNNSIQVIKYGTEDHLGPKSVITNLFNGDSITLRNSFIVSGFSKDQGKFDTRLVQISITTEGSPDNWQDVSSEMINFGRWVYNWSIPGTGSYNLKLRSRDLIGNETISDSTTITVVNDGEGVVSSEQSKLSLDKNESLANGKIYVNALIIIKGANGNLLANKNVELSYLRADGYVAKNTQTTDESGTLVWGVISTVAGTANLTAIADGVELNEHPILIFTNE